MLYVSLFAVHKLNPLPSGQLSRAPMKNLRNLAILGAVLVASASFASATTMSGEINFSGEGGLSGAMNSLLTLTLLNNVADVATATGSFSAFPTTPGFLQPVTVTAFTSPTLPTTLFTTTYRSEERRVGKERRSPWSPDH